MERDKRIWHVVYLDRKYLNEQLLEKYEELYEFKIIIPMVRVLKRVSKGRNEYENVPYLFNLGFIKLPKYLRNNLDYLTELRNNVPFIMGYLKDTMKTGDGDNYARVTAKEINRLIDDAANKSIYDNIEEVIKPGDIIELNGYPWSGLSGEVISINKAKEKAKVRIKRDTFDITVDIPFYNMCYTHYQQEINGMNMREEYLEDLEDYQVDKIYATVSLNLEEDGC